MNNVPRALVLVVEDDPLIRLTTVDVIIAAGYSALEARNADEAIVLLEHNNGIRIVFTDIEMPGSIDGMKLAACVRDRWPPVEIILTSGRFVASDVILPERSVFLKKPYRSAELLNYLHLMSS